MDAADEADRRRIVMLGPRRAGKTSLLKVVYDGVPPNDTFFLAPTTRVQTRHLDTFQALEMWDMPGSALQQFNKHTPSSGGASPDVVSIPWSTVSAVIFVIDAQDDYFDALLKLNQVILAAYAANNDIHFHVFINKVDGLGEDYRYDTQRDIEQRVYDELIDSSHEFPAPASGAPVQLEQAVQLRTHLTSVFDSSAFVAFSNVQQWLMHADSQSDALVSVHDALESACNQLCTTCQFEKAYVFDVPSHTFVGCDSSPFDQALFDIMFDYIRFLVSFTGLYANIHTVSAGTPYTRKWSRSAVRLVSDTSVAFWQLDSRLALLAVMRTGVRACNYDILDFNVSVFRDTIAQLRALARAPA